jgi:hypothetical protein
MQSENFLIILKERYYNFEKIKRMKVSQKHTISLYSYFDKFNNFLDKMRI